MPIAGAARRTNVLWGSFRPDSWSCPEVQKSGRFCDNAGFWQDVPIFRRNSNFFDLSPVVGEPFAIGQIESKIGIGKLTVTSSFPFMLSNVYSFPCRNNSTLIGGATKEFREQLVVRAIELQQQEDDAKWRSISGILDCPAAYHPRNPGEHNIANRR